LEFGPSGSLGRLFVWPIVARIAGDRFRLGGFEAPNFLKLARFVAFRASGASARSHAQ